MKLDIFYFIDSAAMYSPAPDNLPSVDGGVGPGPGTGPGVPHLVVPSLVATPAQTPVFGAPPSYQPFGHQNLLQRAQAGQLREDHLQLLQQALVSVLSAGYGSWFVCWGCWSP